MSSEKDLFNVARQLRRMARVGVQHPACVDALGDRLCRGLSQLEKKACSIHVSFPAAFCWVSKSKCEHCNSGFVVVRAFWHKFCIV